ncbi:uncharacterized protein LOC120824367 [Gasterosteus aculeatus]|uniref:BZIP domain-containing protein n=1 Tax=Gasterosteus aculeatus aculeatus TaxID=481459 RepID=G3PGJ7_GASAC|nr:uncharacterized protein LOC120824367 [Gasterosteus aculeatus aculeatus]
MESLSSPLHGGQGGEDPERKGSRRKREFIPEEKKDAQYWEKRHKNNEAAKRSREKRRLNDHVLESHLMALKEENSRLAAELMAIKLHFGLVHPAAYTAHLSSQLHAHSGPQPATAAGTYHQSLGRDYYRGARESSVMARPQPPHPVYIPAYALHAMRGYSYLNTSGGAGSGLLTPLMLPQNLASYSPLPGAAPLKPVRARTASDEEEEQQVPGLSSPSFPPPPRRIPSRGHRIYSPPRQYTSN